jgi:hypothetical protein
MFRGVDGWRGHGGLWSAGGNRESWSRWGRFFSQSLVKSLHCIDLPVDEVGGLSDGFLVPCSKEVVEEEAARECSLLLGRPLPVPEQICLSRKCWLS